MKDVKPVIQKEDRNLVKIYRRVSAVPAISKILKSIYKNKGVLC